MGEKGARQSPEGAAMAERLTEELASLGDVTSKKMFGGYGVFESGVMFALVNREGSPFLWGRDDSAGRFEEAGSERHGKMPYWAIPDSVLTDHETLIDWAGQALLAARAAKR